MGLFAFIPIKELLAWNVSRLWIKLTAIKGNKRNESTLTPKEQYIIFSVGYVNSL